MKERKVWEISLLVGVSILLNCLGKAITGRFSLPLWLDSYGTMLTAYVLGPVCGGIVGAASNIAVGISADPTFLIYGLTNVIIGIIVGVFSKYGYFNKFFKMSCVASLLAGISVIISTPLNYINGGVIGNLWGEGVHLFLRELGVMNFFCMIVGQFYVEFIDKLLMAFLTFITIRVVFVWKDRKNESLLGCMKKMIKAGCILVLLFSSFAGIGVKAAEVEGYADYNSYVQTIFDKEKGIPCGAANAIVSTNDGILWIGTYAGLYRYSGNKFRMMQEYDTIKNVNCLYVDDEGRLWVGTNDSGLSICINEHLSNVVDKSFGLPSDSVRSVVEASDGRYYVGTSESLAILDLESGLSVVDTIDEIKYTVQMAATTKGYVAAVTSEGNLYVLKDGKILYQIKNKSRRVYYKSVSFSEDGTLYAGTATNQIDTYHVEDDFYTQKKGLRSGRVTEINKLYFHSSGEIFVCGDNGIGFFSSDGVFHELETGEFNNSIDDMVVDYQGNLWFTSSRMGILRLCSSNVVNLYNKYGLKNVVVNAVTKWQSNLYVGTDKGLDIIDEKSGKKIENKLTRKLKGVRVRQMCVAKNGHLFLCTYGLGLVEAEQNGKIIFYTKNGQLTQDRIRTALELSNGMIAVSGESLIAYLYRGKVQHILTEKDGLSGAVTLCMLENEENMLLTGTDGQGIIVVQNGKIIKQLKKEDGLSSEVILRLVKDPVDKGIYIVTSNGLNYMKKDGTIIGLKNFPYYNNYDIVCRDKQVLVLGSAGIYLVAQKDLVNDINNPNYVLFDARYGLDGGLTANAWNYTDEKNNIYLPCDTGVYKMNLQGYAKSETSFRFYVTTADLDGEKVSLSREKTLVVERGISKIIFYPEIINYTRWDPAVSYYLEGVDKEPIVISQKELSAVTYTNLPFGEHVFHIAVLDRDGKTVLEESTYTIEKVRELHDTEYFKIYMFVVLLLMIVWFTWFILRTQFHRAMELQKKELALAKHRVEMGNETILAIAKTVDVKDVNTAQHSQRVSEYSVMIAKKLGFDDEECENLRKAALLHDIGKIGIPDSVLNKPGRLDDEEYKMMKSHVILGANILKDFTLIDNVSDGAKYHHERYDGKGYAAGLSGEDIPVYARIIGIADTFDAMTSNRVYRKKLDLYYVLNEMKKGRGTQFDPKLCDIMIELIENREIDVEALYR